jgi:hypothetical protein
MDVNWHESLFNITLRHKCMVKLPLIGTTFMTDIHLAQYYHATIQSHMWFLRILK